MKSKMHQVLIGGLVCILCAAGALIWSGCDTASATEELSISPSSATLSSGQSQKFSVSGGYHYSWSIASATTSNGAASSTKGSLSSLTGSEVLYTAPSSAPSGGSVTIHVISTIEGSASGTSNSPAYTVEADAIVTFN